VARTDISRRVGLSVVGGAVLLLAYATVYRWGMATFEGEQLSFVRALQVVLEALTTAGFGGDAPWSSTAMNALVIAMNLTGVALVFFAIPFFLVPLLEDAFESDVPTESTLSDHVVVCADSPRETALQAELDERDVPALFVKRDANRVRNLLREGLDAMRGDPETAQTLERANVAEARALLVDIDDAANASVILAARRLAPDCHIVSVVESGETAAYHRYAGADEVVRPRVAVGERLAAKVRETAIHEQIRETCGDSVELTEVLVDEGSPVAGQTLADCAFRQQYGTTVVGGWFHGEFVAPVSPDRTLVEHAVLLVVGEPDGLTTLGRDVAAGDRCERAVVAGYGVVGETVTEALVAADIGVTAVDSQPKSGVDVVGDITDPETLSDADAAAADSVVLTLSEDSLAVYSTLVVADHVPETETLVRADQSDSVQKCYDAGAEFTLSLSEVTAHMVTARLFDSPSENRGDGQIRRLQAPELAGQRLGDAALGTETGVQVVAVERDGQFYQNPGPSFEIRRSDTLVLAGTRAGVTAFERAYAE
jgi:Trk K+ transport system NAD-binding subunit